VIETGKGLRFLCLRKRRKKGGLEVYIFENWPCGFMRKRE
jgi:hypothetical protein